MKAFFRRKAMFISLSLLFVSFCFLNILSAQVTSISGVVNTYTKVTEITPCGVIVESTDGFSVGDRALIIQMKGMQINTSNTSSYGDIMAYNGAGYYEFVTISEINLNLQEIKFTNRLSFKYEPTGLVQLIKIPHYVDAVVTGTVTCPEWNGSTGGVIVIENDNDLAMNADIDASGKGFRGGDLQVYDKEGCTDPNWVSALSSGINAGKGEGCAVFESNMNAGKGHQVNGGGGGNLHNGGGGGGGNGRQGGNGGFEWNFCSSTDNGGRGGLPVDMDTWRAIPGGGGGSGQQNNAGGTKGTNGGGIIIIKTKYLSANGHSISSNGVDQNDMANIDAGGGGGAGGTIFLSYNLLGSDINVSVKGGKGGSVSQTGNCIGPGGGGAGGRVWLSGTSVPGRMSIDTAGGDPGIVALGSPECQGTSYGAEKGQDGRMQLGVRLYESNRSPVSVSISPVIIDFGAVACDGSKTATVTVKNISYADISVDSPILLHGIAFSVPGNTGFGLNPDQSREINVVFHPNNPGYYYDTLVFSGSDLCQSPLIVVLKGSMETIDFSVPESLDLGLICSPGQLTDSLTVTNNSTRATRFRGTIEPDSVFSIEGNPFASLFNLNETRQIKIIFSGTKPGHYTGKLNITDTCNVTKTIYVYAEISDLEVKKLKDIVICHNTGTYKIDSSIYITTGGIPPFKYMWGPAEDFDDPSAAYPTLTKPPDNRSITVTVIDSAGCSGLVQIDIIRKPPPNLEFIPPSLDFADVDSCMSGSMILLRIVNKSDTEANIRDSSTSKAFFVDSSHSYTIPPGDTITLKVWFRHTGQTGQVTGKIIINYEDCDDIPLEASANVKSEGIYYNNDINFGDVGDCIDHVSLLVSITNYNTNLPVKMDRPLTIPDKPFTTGLDSISAFPRIINPSPGPGNVYEFYVTMSKAPRGSYSTVLRIPYELGLCHDTLVINVTGRIIRPDITVSGDLIFGTLKGCDSSARKAITLVISGYAIDSIRDENPPVIHLEQPLYGELPPGSHELGVIFEPQANGAYVGTFRMTLYYKGCDTTIEIPFAGGKSGVAFLTPDTLDFGEIIKCNNEKATLTLPIKNVSQAGVDGMLSGFSFTGDFASTGAISCDMTVGDSLFYNKERVYTLTFAPSDTGTYTGTLELSMEPCGVKRSIVIKGRLSDFALTLNATSCNMGKAYPGETITKDIIFYNSGSATITIDSISPPSEYFNIDYTRPPLPATLEPGDTLLVTVHFVSDKVGRYVGEFRLHASPCDTKIVFRTMAEVESMGDSAFVYIPDASARSGEKINIPLMMHFPGKPGVPKSYDYFCRVSFNKTLLAPLFTAETDNINDTCRILMIKGSALLSDTVLYNMPFIAALGNCDTTIMNILDFQWLAKDLKAGKQNGVFRLDGICMEGGKRLVEPGVVYMINLVGPNPSSGKIEVELDLPETPAELSLYSISGSKIAVLYNGSHGRQSVSFDTGNIGSGVYYLVLRTPTATEARKVVVIK